jgi:four helix bundle protein
VGQGIKSYSDLVAWQLAVELSLLAYEVTREFPDAERFGLTSQIRRASVSIASNIAEGYGRGTTSDYQRFLRIARGSVYEVETQMVIAARLGYLARDRFEEYETKSNECSRVLAGLLKSIEART